jgi:hypothetical protein
MLEASKFVLKSITDLLDYSDDSEVRRIVRMCRNSMKSIENVSKVTDVHQLLAELTPACEALVEVTSLTNKRIDELLHLSIQKNLKDSLENLGKASLLMVSSSKAVVENSTNQFALESRKLCCEFLIQTLSNIETVIQMREWVDPSYDLVSVFYLILAFWTAVRK